MRFTLVVRSLGLLALLGPMGLSSACSSSDGGAVPDPGSTPPELDGGGDAGGDGAVTAPPNDCKLGAITGVVDVTPTFVTHEPPGVAPPAMTGGTLRGKYKVDKAKVFLPTGTKGLADPTKSTGTVNAWALFDGTNYRLYLKADFTLSTVLGPQSQKNDVATQGGFTVTSSALTIDHACDTKPTTAAEYTFTDDGSGRATILIKTKHETYGDTYLLLDAAKQ